MKNLQNWNDFKKVDESKVNEGGHSFDKIASDIYNKLKNDKNWEDKAKKMIHDYTTERSEVSDIMGMLRGEDYFDTGEIDLEESKKVPDGITKGLTKIAGKSFNLSKQELDEMEYSLIEDGEFESPEETIDFIISYCLKIVGKGSKFQVGSQNFKVEAKEYLDKNESVVSEGKISDKLIKNAREGKKIVESYATKLETDFNNLKKDLYKKQEEAAKIANSKQILDMGREVLDERLDELKKLIDEVVFYCTAGSGSFAEFVGDDDEDSLSVYDNED